MKIKHFFTLLLAVLLLVSTFVACSSGGSSSTTPTTEGVTKPPVTTADGTEPPGTTVPPETTEMTFADLPSKNLDGEEIIVLNRDGAATVIWKPRDWDCDVDSSNAIDSAVFNRNLMVEDKLKCTITQRETQDYMALAQVAYLTDTAEDFDICVMPVIQQISLMAAGGYYYDLATVDTIDLSAPWWDQYTNDSMSLIGSYYTVCGDVNMVDELATECIGFNKQMAEDLQLEDLYQLMRDGDWTMDKMYELAAVAQSDEVWGIGIDYMTSLGYLAATGYSTINRDSEGVPELNFTSPAFAEAMSDVYDFFSNRTVQFVAEEIENTYGELYNRFVSNKSLFVGFTFAAVIGDQISDMENPFGILPVPKMYDEMEEYISTFQVGNATGASILRNHPNVEDIAMVLEAMSAASVDTLTPAFYETTLKNRKVHDDESRESLDYIFAHRVVDFGFVISSDTYNVIQATIKNVSGNSFVTLRDAHAEKIQNNILRFLEQIQTNFGDDL